MPRTDTSLKRNVGAFAVDATNLRERLQEVINHIDAIPTGSRIYFSQRMIIAEMLLLSAVELTNGIKIEQVKAECTDWGFYLDVPS